MTGLRVFICWGDPFTSVAVPMLFDDVVVDGLVLDIPGEAVTAALKEPRVNIGERITSLVLIVPPYSSIALSGIRGSNRFIASCWCLAGCRGSSGCRFCC